MNQTMTLADPAKARVYFENKLAFTTGPIELDHRLKAHENINIIDVREEEDYRKGHIPGAINLPKNRWDSLEGLSKDKLNILYCYSQVCHLAATAASHFAASGYPVMELEGGWDEWKDHGLEVDKSDGNRVFNVKH
jgi:rhodanese-related sulfurtransferase